MFSKGLKRENSIPVFALNVFTKESEISSPEMYAESISDLLIFTVSPGDVSFNIISGISDAE